MKPSLDRVLDAASTDHPHDLESDRANGNRLALARGLLVATALIATAALSTEARGTQATSRPWQAVDRQLVATSAAEPRIAPDRYRLLKLNETEWQAILEDLPGQLSIPHPAGGFVRFAIEESPVLPPPLARRFPEIRTFRGHGIDDPTATARFGFTTHGFHGIVLSAEGTFYLEPMYEGDRTLIAVYRKQDYRTAAAFSCFTEGDRRPVTALGGSFTIVDGTLRTYRLALAVTGEYTTFHGGTVADGLSAVVTALNRVNAIYERDVAGRMELVSNNDLLIYTDPATDPYTNNNPFALVFQNQSNLDAVIGDANYDLGHVLSTNGLGGAAEIASICVSGLKGKAVSGLPAPVGDPFVIGQLAHELGHQWGANHTFNGCAQRHAPTAYEPGSGSTIMSYAGICGPQDLQPFSDDYFHVASIEEVIDYLGTGGSACGERIETGNFSTAADAGPDYTIPVSTPFTLCGRGLSPDFDPATANWEQFDLGPEGPAEQPQDNAPIFRSFPPSTDFCRTFPRIGDVLNDTQTFGELLPSYARDLTFRLTIRDNHPGAGAVATDLARLTVTDTAGPFRVLEPETGEIWASGSARPLRWDVAGTNQSPVSCGAVDIHVTLDGGQTFSEVAVDVPNDGEQEITVPDTTSTAARLRVRCSDNAFFDLTDTDLTIFTGGPGGSYAAVFGQLSRLLATRSFDDATCLGYYPFELRFSSTVASMLPDPPADEGYYVLVRTPGGSLGGPGLPERIPLDDDPPCL